MTEKAVLIESSFADAITMIAAANELPEHTRRHWPTSLRKIAEALNKPLEVIPARYSAVRADLLHLHHVPAGIAAKTLANHKSNVKSALLYLAREKGIPQYGTPLTPGCAQWPSDRTARRVSHTHQKLCGIGNRQDLQRNQRSVVDLPSGK